MKSWIAIGMSGLALVISLSAPIEAALKTESATAEKLNTYDENIVSLASIIQELRTEVGHIKEEVKDDLVELGDDLNERIDELGTTIGTLETDVAEKAKEAKEYTDSKFNYLKDVATEKLKKLGVKMPW